MKALHTLCDNGDVIYTYVIKTSAILEVLWKVPFHIRFFDNFFNVLMNKLWPVVPFPAYYGQACIQKKKNNKNKQIKEITRTLKEHANRLVCRVIFSKLLHFLIEYNMRKKNGQVKLYLSHDEVSS